MDTQAWFRCPECGSEDVHAELYTTGVIIFSCKESECDTTTVDEFSPSLPPERSAQWETDFPGTDRLEDFTV